VEVAIEAGRIQQKAMTCGGDGVLAERGTQDVNGEIEQTARAGDVLLRPQHRHRPIARERLRLRSNDQRQERDAVTLRGWATEGSIARAKARAAEELDRDHGGRQLIRS